jgi:hypothetical protein
MAARSATSALATLEAIRAEFGADAVTQKRVTKQKQALLRSLARAILPDAAAILRLHECLLFLRAYPDDAATLALTERLLATFARRRDVKAHRAALADTGVAGADIHFRFFAETARRLAARWPWLLEYDWAQWDDPARLEELLPLLAAHGETPGMDEYDLGLRGWLDRMRGTSAADAAWVTTRLAARVGDAQVFEKLHDGIDAPMVLRSGHATGSPTPTRTHAYWRGARVRYQKTALHRGRPDLRAELARAPLKVTPLGLTDGRRLHDMTLEAMVTRSRDLDAFAYADPHDARMVDCGDGLQFGVLGMRPDRRLLLESVYGMLTLKNGVPIGYVLTSALYGSAEIAYNVFDTYRGAEAGSVYGRVLSMTRALFGVDSFTVYPYQLGGAGNEEGLASGAWWFYRKLGFAPQDRDVRKVVAREEARMANDPSHRSPRATLLKIVDANVYWHASASRRDVIGQLPLANVGLAVTDLLARRFGGDADRGAAECAREAATLLRGGPDAGWSAAETQAFERWAPLMLLLPGAARWSAAEKRAAVRVIRAKGGVRESDFVRAFDAHAPLRAAIAELARKTRA